MKDLPAAHETDDDVSQVFVCHRGEGHRNAWHAQVLDGLVVGRRLAPIVLSSVVVISK